MLLLASGVLASGCEPAQGSLLVHVSLQGSSGDATTCAAFGATSFAVSIYRGSEDLVPYDRLDFPCDSEDHSTRSIRLRTEAGTYSVLRLSLLGGGGDPVRLCLDGGEAGPAIFERGPIEIKADQEIEQQFNVSGERAPCAAQ